MQYGYQRTKAASAALTEAGKKGVRFQGLAFRGTLTSCSVPETTEQEVRRHKTLPYSKGLERGEAGGVQGKNQPKEDKTF